MSTAAGNGNQIARPILRFGVFELDPRTGELRKQGVRIRLQGKPLQILQALLERPGDVVTREELQRRLWPANVFVDFDNGLNTAANRLRIALGDSAEHPRYVETLARTGYRFIAPLEIMEPALPAERPAPVANLTPPLAPAAGPARPSVALRFPVAAVLAAALLAAGTLATVVALRHPIEASARFRQLTFRRGQIWGARFAPDGRSVLYTANWDSGPRRLFFTNPLSPESRALGFEDFRLVSVSRTGELALMAFDGTMPTSGGALSRVPMNGGAPMPIERNVMSADWAPDGRLAMVRAIDGMNQLEFPRGTVVYKTAGWISGVRVSPAGDRIAFLDHPARHDNRGSVKLLNANGTVQALSDEWASVGGIAWSRSRDEIWFTASPDGAPKSLWAVTPSGKLRPVTQTAGTMTLRDIAPDGSALMSRDTERLEMAAVVKGEGTQRDLSWLDWSRVADVSADGRLVLFDESGLAGGEDYSVYLHRADPDSTVRLGDGLGMSLSPDGRFALTLSPRNRTRLRLVPIGDGKTTDLADAGLEYQWARYFPDGRRLLALANEPGQPLRLYVQDLDGKPFAITPPTVVRNAAISPDGSRVAVMSTDNQLLIYPAAPGGTARRIPTTETLSPLLWTADDSLFVQHLGSYTQLPTRISRLHLPTGKLEPWLELQPGDPAGVNAVTKVVLSQDTRTVIFNYRRVLSELFILSTR